MRELRHVLASALVAGLVTATPALADPAIWKVSDADSSIHLFGSVHLFTRDVDWRTPRFDTILEEAEHVIFEVVMDIEAYSTITQITMLEGRITDGGTLEDLLSAEQSARLKNAIFAIGGDWPTFERMQPWLANITLATLATPKASAGVELLLEPQIASDRKRGLETAAEQMGFFSDVPLDEQIEGLMSTVAGIETGASTDLEPLIAAWERGDTAQLSAVMASAFTPADRVLHDRLITERNERWITPLEALLADNDEALVIVGAAHLVGPEGVPALLEAKGYTVERVDELPAEAPPAAGSVDVTRR